VEFQEQVNMIINNFYSMNFVVLLHANIFEDQLTILFNSSIVEYPVSILRHQHDVIGDLTIAMAKTAQFQRLSHPSHRWLAPPVAKVPKTTSFFKELTTCLLLI
jgi:hypothetical protein